MNSLNHPKTGIEVSSDVKLSNAVHAGHYLPGVFVCANRDTQRALLQHDNMVKIDVPTAPAARVKYLKNWAKRQRKTAMSTGFASMLVLPMFAVSAFAQESAAVNASAAEGVVSATIQDDGTLRLTMEDGSTNVIAEGDYSVTADGQIMIEADALAGMESALAGGVMAPVLGVLAGGVALAGGGGSGGDSGGGGSVATTTGFVIDGYISGATVFRDANGNGRLDDGEVSTTTDAQGGFTLGGDQNVSIVAVGGTDISTGLPFTGTLTAPAGSTVITPVTTMIQQIIDADLTGETTVQQATAVANAALGLPADTDVLNEDPIAGENDALFAAGAKIANIVSLGVAAGADETAVLEALAKALAEAEAGERPLNDGTILTDVYVEALDGATPNSDIGDVAQSVANANDVVDERAAEGDTDGIADVQQVVQGDIAEQVEDGEVNDVITADDVDSAADDAEDVVDGNVQFDAAFSEDFDDPIALADGQTPVDGSWYVDRSAPAGFGISDFEGESVLRQTIAPNSDDDQNSFFDTQGRKFDLPSEATEISIQMYIGPDWAPADEATSGFRQAGFWTTALDETGEIGGYPIIEFSTLEGEPNFRVWTGVDDPEWIDLGVPEGFEYGTFQDLKIAINDDGSVTYTVGSITEVVTTFDIVALDNVILQGYNQVPGDEDGDRAPYDILWDNIEVTSEAGFVDQDVNISKFGLNVDFLSSSYEILDDVVLTLTSGQADGLTLFGNGTVKLVGPFDSDVDLSGISTAIDVTEVEGFALTLTAEQADGAEIDLADSATLTIDVDYADLSSENQSLSPEIDISGITVNGSSSPVDLFQVLDAGSVADTFKLIWNAADNAYYDAFPGGTADVNGANIELGNLYAQYLLDGGEPLLDIVQTKVSGTPDFEGRQQSLHDNLLGNLNDAAVNSRLNSVPPQLNEDNRDAAGLQFHDRPIYDGNDGNEGDLLASQVWDVANGIPREDFTPGDGEIYVLNGNNVVDGDPVTDGIQSFTDLDAARLASDDGAYIVIGAGTYAGDLTIIGTVTVMGVGEVIIDGGFRVEPDPNGSSSVVTITGLDLDLKETNSYGFYVRGDDVTLNLTDTSVTGAEGVSARGIETEIGTEPTINVSGGTFSDLTTGIYLNPSATLNVDDTTFTGNTAGIGTDDPAAITVTDSTFDGNNEAIGFSGDVDNSNVTLSGNQYVQETDQVLLYFAREEPVVISGEWDNVTIVQSDQATITGTDGDDVIVDNALDTVIDLTAGGSDFVLFVPGDAEEGINQILGFTAGATEDGGDILSFTSETGALADLRGMTVETLEEGDAIGSDTGFVVFTTEVEFTSSFSDLVQAGLSGIELTALLEAADSLEGGEDGSVIMAVSNGEDTLILDVDMDDQVASGDRVAGIAYLENTVSSDLTADNLYDFSAVSANT